MKDGVIQICVAILNFFCVALVCCTAGPPETLGMGFLRLCLIMGYFGTLIYLTKGEDDDSNNNSEDDDLQDL